MAKAKKSIKGGAGSISYRYLQPGLGFPLGEFPGSYHWSGPVPSQAETAEIFQVQAERLRTNFTRGKGGNVGQRILKEQQLDVEDWTASAIWAVVVSTNVSLIRYLQNVGQLWVVYSSRGGPGRMYVYYDVPEIIAQRFFLSPSLGKFTHDAIIGSYPVRQVTF